MRSGKNKLFENVGRDLGRGRDEIRMKEKRVETSFGGKCDLSEMCFWFVIIRSEATMTTTTTTTTTARQEQIKIINDCCSLGCSAVSLSPTLSSFSLSPSLSLSPSFPHSLLSLLSLRFIDDNDDGDQTVSSSIAKETLRQGQLVKTAQLCHDSAWDLTRCELEYKYSVLGLGINTFNENRSLKMF